MMTLHSGATKSAGGGRRPHAPVTAASIAAIPPLPSASPTISLHMLHLLGGFGSENESES